MSAATMDRAELERLERQLGTAFPYVPESVLCVNSDNAIVHREE